MKSGETVFRVLTLMAIALLACGVANGGYEDRLVPEAIVHSGRVSQSGWIWNSVKPISDGAESFFRASFALDELPEKVTLHACFDDSGEIFVNGVRMPFVERDRTAVVESAIKRVLVRGKNVIAASVKNGSGPGAAIFLLKATLSGGKIVTVSSDEMVKASSTATEGWCNHDFDDSEWPCALFQGDVLAYPWGRASWASMEILGKFMTIGERRRYDEEERRSIELPQGWSAGPEPDAAVVYENNRPMVRVAGRTYEPDWYLGNADSKWTQSIVYKLGKMGIDFVQMEASSSHFEKDVGRYEFEELDRDVRRAIRMNPNVKVMVKVQLKLEKWLAAHPEEAIVYAAGPVKPGSNEHRGRPFRASPASESYRQEACRALRSLCEWIRRQPWANRVVAIRPNWGIYQEWHMYGMWDGPDVGPRMTEAFRRYKGGKWAGEDAPTMAERTVDEFLYDPVRDAKVVDFFNCQQEQVADLAAAFASTIKKYLPGRLVGMWYGYVLTAQAPEGSNVLLDRMLSNPDIDWLSDPAEYRTRLRRAGGSYMHRTVPATFHRYGKLVLLEDDNRYDWSRPWAEDALLMQTPQESVATVQRNYLSKLFDRCGIQYTDPIPGNGTRPHLIDNEIVLSGLSSAMRAYNAAKDSVPTDSGADTAVVVDYHERFYWNAQSRKTNPIGVQVFGDSPIAVSTCGCVFDMLTVEDYLASGMRYRTVAFLNLFHPDAKHLAGIRIRLRRDGSDVIRIAPDGAPSVDLGMHVMESRTVPVTDWAWADLFARTKTHAYVEPGRYFRRNGDLMMLHVGTSGRHRVMMPSADAGTWYEDVLNGGLYEAPVIEVVCEGPKTWLFKKKGMRK